MQRSSNVAKWVGVIVVIVIAVGGAVWTAASINATAENARAGVEDNKADIDTVEARQEVMAREVSEIHSDVKVLLDRTKDGR